MKMCMDTGKWVQQISENTNRQLIWIASISLLVGGIGVMNIMLVSVTERTGEIGLKKAIGANKKRILGQFLTEAAVLTSIGGILGVLAGIILARIISKIAYALPFVHAVELERAVLDGNWTNVFPHLLWVLGYGVAISGIAVLLFLRQMKRQ